MDFIYLEQFSSLSAAPGMHPLAVFAFPIVGKEAKQFNPWIELKISEIILLMSH